jgi:hypothetical protein
MKKACLFCGFLLCALIGFSGCNKTKVHVGQDGNDEDDQTDNYQEAQPVVWIGPGWYYGLWFGTQLDLLYWNRHYYHYNHGYYRNGYRGNHGNHGNHGRGGRSQGNGARHGGNGGGHRGGGGGGGGHRSGGGGGHHK